MTRAAYLTGAQAAGHKYPSRPLLDARCPGLRLEALQPQGGRQKCTWTYRYRTRERRLRQIKLGTYPQMSLSEARHAWDEQKRVRDDMLRGDPRAEVAKLMAARLQAAVAAKIAHYSVEQLCVDYLSEHVDHQRKRSVEPRRLLTREVIPLIGSKAASQILRSDLHGLVQAIVGRGAERIAQMVLGELKAAYVHAVGAGRLAAAHVNPCVGIKLPAAKSRSRAFTDAELQKFIGWPQSPSRGKRIAIQPFMTS